MQDSNRYRELGPQPVERKGRNEIVEFLGDLGIDTPSYLENPDGKEDLDSSKYRLEGEISLQGNYDSWDLFGTLLLHNDPVVAHLEARILYDGSRVGELHDTYERAAQDVFPVEDRQEDVSPGETESENSVMAD